MGLRVEIVRGRYDSELNVFHGRETVVVTNVEGPFEPTEKEPAALLSSNAFGQPILVPAEGPTQKEAAGPMSGGTYAASVDSRFGKATGIYGAIPVHDRFEPWPLYEAMLR